MKDYIPLKTLDYYHPVSFKEESYDIISKGQILCPCSCKDFSIRYKGDLRKGLFGQVSLHALDENDLGISLTCNECGKSLILFDIKTDGYDAVIEENLSPVNSSHVELQTLLCPKCQKGQYFVNVKYAHYPKTETDEDGIQDYKNAFQWIWVDLECSSCSKKFKNFVDIETA